GRAFELHVVHEAAHEEDAAAARFEDVLGVEGIGNLVWVEAFTLIANAYYQLARRVAGHERELDGHDLGGMFAVAVLDRVDDALANGDADPVDGIFVHGRHLPHAVAQDLDEIQHVEKARDLQPDEAAASHHAVRGFRTGSMQDTRVNNI